MPEHSNSLKANTVVSSLLSKSMAEASGEPSACLDTQPQEDRQDLVKLQKNLFIQNDKEERNP